MSQKERITAPRLRISAGFSGGGCFSVEGEREEGDEVTWSGCDVVVALSPLEIAALAETVTAAP